jgi:RNA polymerase-interacting CarD/CdnL/TRCF family regulator
MYYRIDQEKFMTNEYVQYNLDDWVVHRFYGVGRITKVEPKPVNDEVVECFRVEIRDGAYWVPTQNSDNPRIRPVASSTTLKKAVKSIQNAEPIENPDRKIWKKRIDDTKSSGEFMELCSMIRDLTALNTMRKRNQTEDEALGFFTDRLLSEWVASTGEDIEVAREKLDQYLENCRDQAAQNLEEDD